jgi:hypothetical protein
MSDATFVAAGQLVAARSRGDDDSSVVAVSRALSVGLPLPEESLPERDVVAVGILNAELAKAVRGVPCSRSGRLGFHHAPGDRDG